MMLSTRVNMRLTQPVLGEFELVLVVFGYVNIRYGTAPTWTGPQNPTKYCFAFRFCLLAFD